jgi:uncharacterized repeat protein (TIGR02543 family)
MKVKLWQAFFLIALVFGLVFVSCDNGSVRRNPGNNNNNGGNGDTTYTITIQNDGNGTASADKESAEAGETISISVMPNNGYKFLEWEVVSGGATLSSTTESPAEFTMPARNVTIKASFAALPPNTPNLMLEPAYISFDSVTFGYSQPAARTIAIKNTGTGEAVVSEIVLNDSTAFILDGNLTPTIDINGTAEITVQPQTGLIAGTYSTTITVSYDGGEPATANVSFTVIPVYTVTFNSNGGSTVNPISGVMHGTTITQPANPTTTAGGVTLNRFRGWYTDNGTFTNAFNFSTNITSNITLYADWGYRAGDTGPGGGIIFYRVPSGSFTVAASPAGTPAGRT